jgi:hypothetical protein
MVLQNCGNCRHKNQVNLTFLIIVASFALAYWHMERTLRSVLEGGSNGVADLVPEAAGEAAGVRVKCQSRDSGT